MSLENQLRLDNVLWAIGTAIFIAVTSTLLGYIASRVAKLFGLSQQEQRRVFWGFTFAGPWIVGFFIFVVGPAGASLYYSFTDYQLGKPREWLGLDNYRTLLLGEGRQGRLFKQALFNSFYYTLIGVPLQIIAALSMAMLLNRDIPGIRIFRTTFYLPVILAGSPAALLAWRYMLTGNGGFVNVTLRRIASSFFVFDNLYRLFILVTEGTSGFYEAFAKGDPIGPFKYTLPGLIGLLVLLALRGEWGESKRVLAWRAAQLIGLALLGNIISTGIVAKPVNLSWTLFASIVVLAGIMVNAWQKQWLTVRGWQVGALAFFIGSFGATLYYGEFDFGNSGMTRYLIVIAIGLLPIIGTFFGTWNRRKYLLYSAIAALFSLIIFIRVAPDQFEDGRLEAFWRYLTFQSLIEQPDNLDYLNDVLPASILSAQWIYGIVIAIVLGIALLNTDYPRARQYLLYAGFIFLGVFTLGSFLDGRAYFNAFADISKATDTPNYHFTLFRTAVAEFPGDDRVPLWMTNQLWNKPALLLITMWSSGAGMLIFLAALKGVPRSLYEAAEVDGANNFQKFWKITLPLISPALFYNIVIGMIAALQTFDSIYILRTPGSASEQTLASAAYFLFTRTFTQLQIGEGAAASWILAAIIVTLTILQFRYSRWVHYEA